MVFKITNTSKNKLKREGEIKFVSNGNVTAGSTILKVRTVLKTYAAYPINKFAYNC